MVTIIRSIPSLYESTFGYMNTQVAAFGRASYFRAFAAAPEKYYDENKNGNGWEHFAKNHLAFDLGFDNKIDDKKLIEQYVIQMDYDLVVIR